MWFKELIEMWRHDNSLSQALDDSNNMLEQTLVMFRESVYSLRESSNGEMRINIYEMDQTVNDYIRLVRRKVLQYLAITGGMNIIPGLILISIVIDIERIGDYTKNIADLARGHARKLDGGKFEADFQKIEQSVREIFEKLIGFQQTADRAGAAELIRDNYWVLKRCDEIVNHLIEEEDKELSPADAASRALYSRYLKRIAGHLINIASSMVNPFEQIGFKGDEE